MKNIINIKETLKGLLIILSYFILPTIIYMPFYFFERKEIINYQVSMILTYFFTAIVYSYIYRKDLIKDIKNFKENYKLILSTTIKYWFIGLIVMVISSNIINMIGIAPNTNQEGNIELLRKYPLFEITCACFIAPIIEELVYRRSLKNATSNKHLFALTSGIIFGLVHVLSSISSSSDLIMLIYLIPFSSVGISFGYAYYKTNNIYGTIIIHSIHNIISIIQIIILGGLI
ncbi:MAG TPA: CPBP family intramembrane metalloprotease [Candidatus Coprovivens excrementavium]|nr:CPBP family intramembrane metalloprotease [Candidatus Coprovivens excrementavium]